MGGVFALITGTDCAETVDAAAPHRFEPFKQTVRVTKGVDIAAYQLIASRPLLRDEPGALQHGDVLWTAAKLIG